MIRGSQQTLFHRGHTEATRSIKRCSVSPIIWEMQIKATVRCRFPPVTMTVIRKTRDSKCRWGRGEKGTLVLSWWECKLAQPLWEIVWRFLKKIKNKTALWPTNSTLGRIYPKKTTTLIWKDVFSTTHTVALFTIAKTREQLKCPLMDEWIKKMHYTQTMKYYLAIKKGNLKILNNRKGPWEHYVK